MKDIDIIYEDNDIIVAYKPAGLASETANVAREDMVSLLRNYRVRRGEDSYIGMVSRLDQVVEGVMIFGKNKRATASLSKQVQDKVLRKTYYAAVLEWTLENEGSLEDYIIKDGKNNMSRICDPSCKGAKIASLDYRLVYEDANKSVLQINLNTGRHHQIRVQLANVGSSIIGDSKYAPTNHYRSSRVEYDYAGLALCAARIDFIHPTSKEEMSFVIDSKNPLFANVNFEDL